MTGVGFRLDGDEVTRNVQPRNRLPMVNLVPGRESIKPVF
jgi:hypothetical protein